MKMEEIRKIMREMKNNDISEAEENSSFWYLRCERLTAVLLYL
jgi:hypothetical protein